MSSSPSRTIGPGFKAFKNLGANATLNVKPTHGYVGSLSCHNENAAGHYIQLHDTATTPAGGAVPKFSFYVPPTSQIIAGTDFFGEKGIEFVAGIAFAWSSTKDTYTAGTAADHSTWVNYD